MPSSRFVPLLCSAILLMCTACAPSVPPQTSVSDRSQPQPEPALSNVSSEPAPAAPILPDEPSTPAIFIPEPPAPAVSTPQPEPTEPAPPPPAPEPSIPEEPPVIEPPVPTPSLSYDFSQPVPENPAVSSDYFADAVFVGDSRSEGFYLYGVKRGKNLSSSGLSVFTFATKKAFTIGGVSYTAREALALKQYAKVYLGFGVNELGYINADSFYQTYCETIDAVLACQPNAVVYAQTILPVNEAAVAASGGQRHLNNERIRMYNDLIRKAAQEKCIPLLDLYSALAVDGSLPSGASKDGVHLSREYYQKQLDYVQRHTITFDALYTTPEPEVPTDETTSPPADSSSDPAADSLLTQPDEPPLPIEPDPDADTAAV